MAKINFNLDELKYLKKKYKSSGKKLKEYYDFDKIKKELEEFFNE